MRSLRSGFVTEVGRQRVPRSAMMAMLSFRGECDGLFCKPSPVLPHRNEPHCAHPIDVSPSGMLLAKKVGAGTLLRKFGQLRIAG